MARIPDIQDLGPRPTPTSSRQVATVRNAGAVGEAVAEIGTKVSAVVQRLEEIHDDADVRRLDVEHATKAREIRQRARQARGVNAEAARLQADEDLRALDAGIVSQARSRTSRQAVEALVARRSSLERDSISEHTLRETTAAMEAGITARINTSVEEAAERWETPEAVEQGLNTAVTEIENRGRWRGADPAQTANEVAAARSQVRSAVVEQMIQTENFDGAQAYLNLHAGEINHEQEVALRRIVNAGTRALEDDSNAALAISGAPVASEAAAPAPNARPPAQTVGEPRSTPLNEGDQPERFSVGGGFVYGDGHGARRNRPGGRTGPHGGGDLFAPTGTPFPMARDYEVLSSRAAGGYAGNTARVRVGNAEWLAMHLPDLPARGRTAIRSGHSGNASADAPHIHWQPANPAARAIYNQGRRAVAAHLTGAGGATASGAGSPPPDGTTIDIDRAYARIDRMDITPSAKLRARERVRELAAQNDQVRNRIRQDADEEITRALTAIAGRNGRLTNISQLPAAALTRASPNTLLQINETIRANNQPREVEANSPTFVALISEAAENPSGFLNRNPELLRGRISDAEVTWVARQQAELASRSGAAPSEINTMFNLLVEQGGVVPDAPDQEARQGNETSAQARARLVREARARVIPAVQDRLRRSHPPGTAYSQDMILEAIRVEMTPGGFLGGVVQRATETPVPPRAVPLVDRALRRAGVPITESNRQNFYVRNRRAFDAAD